jgi:hypothetical protein
MRIILNKKEINLSIKGKKKIEEIFSQLNLNPLSYIVIDRHTESLLTPDVYVDDSAFLELRPVISGG